MVMLSKVEHLVNGVSEHILSELDKENANLEDKSATKALNEQYRKKSTSA